MKISSEDAQTETLTTEHVVEVVREDGTWKAKPGVLVVAPDDTVIIKPQRPVWVYLMDDRIFGIRRFRVLPKEEHPELVVLTREKGLYPYAVLVDTGEETREPYVLAEGSALPVFLVEY